MTSTTLQHYQTRLRALAQRMQATVTESEAQTRRPTGGEAAGDLSNTPIHLGDIGSEVYAQELEATLLENEQYLQKEILDALYRIEQGTFGRCENCGQDISAERLEALPYARYCVQCATQLHSGREVNLNEGRPKSWAEGFGLRADGPPPGAPGGPPEHEPDGGDPHAVGTPGGGTAIGGLAGTNIGIGGPDNSSLEDAMASGNFDVTIETEQHPSSPDSPVVDETTSYAGPAGGAVGGTPANKRVSGGKRP